MVFIPPNTTGLVQPIDQIIANVKAACVRNTFTLLDAATDTDKIAAKEDKWVGNIAVCTDVPKSDSKPDNYIPIEARTSPPPLLQNPQAISATEFWKQFILLIFELHIFFIYFFPIGVEI